jgi:hypothetical protein
MIPSRREEPQGSCAEGKSLRLFLRSQTKGDSHMALRAGFAAASLLGVVTTFGTTLWVATVVLLIALAGGLLALEVLPRSERSRER